MKTFFNLLYNLLMILLITATATYFQVPAAAVLLIDALCVIYMFTPRKDVIAGARNEVIRTIFSNDLQKLLFPDNSFYAGCQVDEGAWTAESFEIPQDEDGEAKVYVNPTQYPIPTTIEEDKKKTYAADTLITERTMVTWTNQMLTTYDKRAAKLWKHQMSLDRQMAERIMYAWATSKEPFIRQTTGSTTRTATAPGASGNRKVAIEADFLWAFTLFNSLNIPMEGRRVVVPPVFLEDIIAIKKSYGQGTDSNNELLAKGAVTRIFTFDVFVRSNTQVYTEASPPAKKAIGAAPASTDNVSALFYHTRHVRYGKSPVQVWVDDKPRGEYGGGIGMNCGLRSGGTISRLSEIGVAALVEDNG